MDLMHGNHNKTRKYYGKPTRKKCAHERFYGKILDYAKYLRTFGEMGVVRSIVTVKSKLEEQGKTCMFLGYSKAHTGGTYCMLNLLKIHLILSREIIWLNKTYGEYLPRKENTNTDTYILQDKDDPNNWAHIKIDLFNNEVSTENVKTEENVNTEQDYRGG